MIRTCSIKKMVVEKDPTEQGDRALLNLGHTIGHAIEKYKNFELYHGECVALGTVAAAYISWKKEMLSMEEFYEIRVAEHRGVIMKNFMRSVICLYRFICQSPWKISIRRRS